MDQAVLLRGFDRANMTQSVTEFVAASVERARVVDAPFYHLELDNIFPDDAYAAMLRAMPEAARVRDQACRTGVDRG